MSNANAFTLRPLERSPSSTSANALEGAFRVHLSHRELQKLNVSSGDRVRLQTAADFKGYAVAWEMSPKNAMNKPIAKVTDLLREQYGLSLNDPVFIEKSTDSAKPLKSCEVGLSDALASTTMPCSTEELLFWARHALGRVSHFNSSWCYVL
jgi:AAA family ATPase